MRILFCHGYIFFSEIDRFDTRLGICPLLQDPGAYNADTVDLTRDSDARSYWLKCFEDSLNKFADRAVESQEHSSGKFEISRIYYFSFVI